MNIHKRIAGATRWLISRSEARRFVELAFRLLLGREASRPELEFHTQNLRLSQSPASALMAIHNIKARKNACPPYDLGADERVRPFLDPAALAFSAELENAAAVPEEAYEAAWREIVGADIPDEQRTYGTVHKRRFYELVNLVARLAGDVDAPRILEFGASEFTRLYKRFVPAARLSVADFPNPHFNRAYVRAALGADAHEEIDLLDVPRYGDYRARLGAFDIVVFAEVLEHLYVNPVELFGFLLGLLEPGGALVVTTPNMFARHKRAALLAYENPLPPFPPHGERHLGRDHVREYGHIELLRCVDAAGGKVRALVFSACWDDRDDPEIRKNPVSRQNLVLVATRRGGPGSA